MCVVYAIYYLQCNVDLWLVHSSTAMMFCCALLWFCIVVRCVLLLLVRCIGVDESRGRIMYAVCLCVVCFSVQLVFPFSINNCSLLTNGILSVSVFLDNNVVFFFVFSSLLGISYNRFMLYVYYNIVIVVCVACNKCAVIVFVGFVCGWQDQLNQR